MTIGSLNAIERRAVFRRQRDERRAHGVCAPAWIYEPGLGPTGSHAAVDRGVIK